MHQCTRNAYVNRILRIAYLNQGIKLGEMDFPTLPSVPSDEVVKVLVDSARERLRKLFQHDILVESPSVRKINFDGVELLVCLINDQAIEWYSQSPIENFDFTTEDKAGLLPKGGVIFDIGAHQGVWSMYYCLRDRTTSVYCFEPSIINVEAICINMLLNGVDNLCIIPSAVGTVGTDVSPGSAKSDMLVDFVGDRIHVVNFENFAGHKVDFAKVDIEGFEFDLITKFDWFFDFATHYHLELHIPHLAHRGLDYRAAYRRIPFDKFSIEDWQTKMPVVVKEDSDLSGFATLLMKRRN